MVVEWGGAGSFQRFQMMQAGSDGAARAVAATTLAACGAREAARVPRERSTVGDRRGPIECEGLREGREHSMCVVE